MGAFLVSIAQVGLTGETYFRSGPEQTVFIELFTSEGCSSCPPAERKLNALKDNPDLWKTIFPVAFHVDYWDYLGWKDRFAKTSYANRQRYYAQANHVSGVYTPSFLVNGKSAGVRLSPIPRREQKAGFLRVRVQGDQVTVAFTPDEQKKLNEIEFHLALIGMGLETNITRGENRGRLSNHEFVVLDHTKQRQQNTVWRTSLPRTTQPADRYALVAWVTQAGSLFPIQTTGGYLPN